MHGKYREASKEARLTNQNARLAEEELEKLRLAQSQAHDATNRQAQVCHCSLQCTSARVRLVCVLVLHHVKEQRISLCMLLHCTMQCICMRVARTCTCLQICVLLADMRGAFQRAMCQWYYSSNSDVFINKSFVCVRAAAGGGCPRSAAVWPARQQQERCGSRSGGCAPARGAGGAAGTVRTWRNNSPPKQ